MTERTSVTLSMSCDVGAHDPGLPRIWHYADTDLDAARLRATCDGWVSDVVQMPIYGAIPVHRCPHCARSSQ